MIASISGKITEVSGSSCVVEVAGFGVLVFTTPAVAIKQKIGDATSFFTSLVLREDSVSLYGFLEKAEKDLFDLLLAVSGVGPKLALAVLSELTVSDIAEAVAEDKFEVFNSVSGIGPKTAKLIILSLSGKITNSGNGHSSNQTDLIIALMGLGWGEKESKLALKEIDIEKLGRQESLKLALKALGELKGKKR